jgi:hypothetical protein
MRCLLGVLLRLAVGVMVGLGVTAVLIGRYAPGSGSDPLIGLRAPSWPRYHELGGYRFPGCRHPSYLLDKETGAVVTVSVSDAESLDLLICSPWRDGHGQFHLVGRWRGIADRGCAALPQAFGLAWCTFPEGKIVDRVALEPIPVGNPCWYPDASGRVLYADGGGRLYQLASRGEGDGSGGLIPSVRPRPIRWQIDPPGRGVELIQDLHWPNASLFGGRVLASLAYRERGNASLGQGLHLWWLELGVDGTEVVAADRLISAGGTDVDVPAGSGEERLAVVGPMHEGTAMLAYLSHGRSRVAWDLMVAPIAPSWRVGGVPKLSPSAVRKLAEGCDPVAPAFSADGRWIYVMRHSAGPGARLERFLVAENDDPSVALDAE